jgi:hypothetical protein
MDSADLLSLSYSLDRNCSFGAGSMTESDKFSLDIYERLVCWS